MCEKTRRIAILFIVLSLLVPVLSFAGVQGGNGLVTEPTRSTDDSFDGEYMSFNYETDQDIILKDFNYLKNGTSHEIFERLKIDNPKETTPTVITSDAEIQFQTNNFNLVIKDNEQAGLQVTTQLRAQVTDKVGVQVLFGEDTTFAEEGLDLIVEDKYKLDFSWENKTDLEFNTGDNVDWQLSLNLTRDGLFNSNISPQDSTGEDDQDRSDVREDFPSLRFTEDGWETTRFPSSMDVSEGAYSEKRVNFTLQSDITVKQILRVNISRDVLGMGLNEIDDLQVEIGGEKSSGIGSLKEFYMTQEVGHHISITSTEIHLYLRVNLTGSSTTVEVSDESVPVSSSEKPPSISVDNEGKISANPVADISAEKRESSEGELKLDIIPDFNGSRVIRLNISKHVIGEVSENTTDLTVYIGEKRLGYVEPWKLHDTEKTGYYLNRTDGKTAVYLKTNFTKGENQTVSVVDEKALQPETSSDQDQSNQDQAMTSTYSYLGLAAGIITITAASVAVFKKDR